MSKVESKICFLLFLWPDFLPWNKGHWCGMPWFHGVHYLKCHDDYIWFITLISKNVKRRAKLSFSHPEALLEERAERFISWLWHLQCGWGWNSWQHCKEVVPEVPVWGHWHWRQVQVRTLINQQWSIPVQNCWRQFPVQNCWRQFQHKHSNLSVQPGLSQALLSFMTSQNGTHFWLTYWQGHGHTM